MITLPYLHCLPLPTPFPVGPVNVYLALGEPLTLIDTGPFDDLSRTALEAGLAEYGHRVEDLRRVIITHHHVDHMGLAGEVVARSGAEVWTHPYNFPWLSDNAAERARHQPFYEKIWRESGVPAEIVAEMGHSNTLVWRWAQPVKASHSLQEGQVISIGGDDWRVLHTPGHAGGLICLWEPRSRTLLSSDHLILDISSNPVLEPTPLASGPRPKRLVEYLHHMRRTAALEPAVALSGHGEPVTDVAGLVSTRVAFHHRRAERILGALNGRPQTLWELTNPLFPRLRNGMDYFLALSEVQAHLDLLEAAGRARPVPDGAVLRWTCIEQVSGVYSQP